MNYAIRNGWLLPEGVDPLAVPAQLEQTILRARLLADAQEVYETAIDLVDRYSLHRDVTRLPRARAHDNAELEPMHRPQNPWRSALCILSHRERREDPSTVFHDDHRFGARLMRDPGTGRVLAFVDCPEPDIREAFHALAAELGWKDYIFWHIGERPDGVSAEEWDLRRTTWERTLDGLPRSAEVRVHVAPDLSYRTEPQISGGWLSPEEEEAIQTVTPRTPQQRLRRLLTDAVAGVLREDGEEDPIHAVIEAERITRDHTLPQELTERMGEPSVDQLRGRRDDDDPVLGHGIDEKRLHAAGRVMVDAHRERRG